MPYTPPSHPSPVLSNASSPVLTRSPSSTEDVHGARSPVTGRPQPPRSNSAAYLHKHRRSPSISTADAAPPTPTEAPDAPESHGHGDEATPEVRAPPPPPAVHTLQMPSGMMMSPPDSSENSDGEDAGHDHRGRGLETHWDQLKEAVQAIDQKREGSPGSVGVHLPPAAAEPARAALSPEARKIAHSRSSTETAIVIPKSTDFESPTQTSDESDEDQDPLAKPALVRKKSGELVKPALRPSSRRRYSSMPGTPTYSKSVHFNDSDNQTRHFLQVDKPIAVSAGSSPVETYDHQSEFPFDDAEQTKSSREIKLANFPADTPERKTKPVRLERIFLSADKDSLIGTCAVQNIAFHKEVHARFTLDSWKTTSEVSAEYDNNPRSQSADGCDRFRFLIRLSDLANIDTKTLLLCLRYKVNGQEYWDNNDSMNYRVDFVRSAKKTAKFGGLGSRPLNAIPRSRHTGHSLPPTTRTRDHPAADDRARADTDRGYGFGTADRLFGDSSNTIKFKPRSNPNSASPSSASSHPTNGLGGRYDFGASLSAALSPQDKVGRQSSSPPDNAPKPARRGGYFGPIDRTDGPTKVDERPDSLTTDRPAMGSDQYRDLVQKFCYFTPGSGKTAGSPQATTKPTSPQLTNGAAADNDATSSSSSSASTPSPVPDDYNGRVPSALSQFISRSGSPVPMTGGNFGARTASPISFGFPYHAGSRDGYFSDSPTPTAIPG